MSQTLVKLVGVSPTAGAAKRAVDIVAALSPPPQSDGVSGEEKPAPAQTPSLTAFIPGAIGAGVGALAWKEHRVLGALVGHAVASTAMPLVRGGSQRRRALCQLGVELAGVVGSIWYGKKGHPVLGWAGGIAAGVAASAFVPGSAANDWWKERSK